MPGRLLSTICLFIIAMWVFGACSDEDPILHNGDPNNEDLIPYNEIAAGQLDPTGCETYIGAHPTNPGELLCCSAPSKGSAPKCAPGDTPDIPCVVEFKFCEDGTAMKNFRHSQNPDIQGTPSARADHGPLILALAS